MNDDDEIPTAEIHRNIKIHDGQSAERIALVVKPAIDQVYEISSLASLLAYARNIVNPPEARIFAAAKCEAVFQIAVDERRERPDLDIDTVRASVAGLDSKRWRSRTKFCSGLCTPPAPGQPDAAPRDVPLAERSYDRSKAK